MSSFCGLLICVSSRETQYDVILSDATLIIDELEVITEVVEGIDALERVEIVVQLAGE